MGFSVVYPGCFNKEGGCFHYASYFVDSKPILMSGEELQSTPGFECRALSSTPQTNSSSQCGNPWNRFSKEYAAEIRRQQPEEYITSQPTYGRRPVVDIDVLDTPRAIEAIASFIGGDCWSVYSRDKSSHKVQQKLYFAVDTWDETTQSHDQALERAVRKNLMQKETINGVLENLGDSGELCISLGCVPFIDLYIRKIGDCGGAAVWLFTHIQVDITVNDRA